MLRILLLLVFVSAIRAAIKKCNQTVCHNGANCTADGDVYQCVCRRGYTGFYCELEIAEIDECASNPCQNGGICTDEYNTYRCNCTNGYRGPNCEDGTANVYLSSSYSVLVTGVLGSYLVTVVVILIAAFLKYKNRIRKQHRLPEVQPILFRRTACFDVISNVTRQIKVTSNENDIQLTEHLLESNEVSSLDTVSENESEIIEKQVVRREYATGEQKFSIVRPVKAARVNEAEQNTYGKDPRPTDSKGAFGIAADYSVFNELTVFPLHRDRDNESCNSIQHGDEDFNERLNWDQIFSFLARKMPPKSYHFFFLSLYEYGRAMLQEGTSIHNIITQVSGGGGNGSQTCLLNLFWQWKSLLGKEAKISHIKDSLKEMEDTETLDSLERFLSRLPLLPQQNASPMRYPGFPTTYSLGLAAPFDDNDSRTEAQSFQRHSHMFQQRHQFGSYNNENNMLVYHQSKRSSFTSTLPLGCTPSNGPASLPVPQSFLGKRRKHETDSSESDTECSPNKEKRSCRKILESSSLKVLYPKMCNTLVPWTDVNHNLTIGLLKTVMSTCKTTSAIHYNLFLNHTVKIIMNTTQKSEAEVLSITCEDIDRCEEKKSKRGHVIYIIDSDCGYLTVGVEEWDCLKIFKQQRDDVCQRKLTENNAFVSSVYLFVDYDGQPVNSQNQKKDIKDVDCDQEVNINNIGPAALQIKEHLADAQTSTTEHRRKNNLVEEITSKESLSVLKEECKNHEKVKCNRGVVGTMESRGDAICNKAVPHASEKHIMKACNKIRLESNRNNVERRKSV